MLPAISVTLIDVKLTFVCPAESLIAPLKTVEPTRGNCLIPQALLRILNMASLGLAGAGVLSVDARIFGRQVVKILP